MKTIRLLLLCVLAGMALSSNAQSYLPQKSAFAIGAGPMWGIVEGNGNYHDAVGSSTCGSLVMDYRYYAIPNIGLGVAYNHLWGNKDGNKLSCNYVAPTLTARWLWTEGKQGFWMTVGAGYFGYKDELRYGGSFNKGYFGGSFSFGYEFAIGNAVGLQLRADCIAADFKYTGHRTCCGNYHDDWDSSMSYFSIGAALVFGK